MLFLETLMQEINYGDSLLTIKEVNTYVDGIKIMA